MEILEEEAARYELFDESKRQIDSTWALAASSGFVGELHSGIKAIYAIEKLAAHLYEHYEVKNQAPARNSNAG